MPLSRPPRFLCSGYWSRTLIDRRAIRAWRWVDALALFLFTLPGTVLGIGLIGLWNRPSTNWIYATPAMLLIALVAANGSPELIAALCLLAILLALVPLGGLGLAWRFWSRPA